MTKTVLQLIALFFVLVLVQIIFSKISLFGIATPIIFIYLLLRLPIATSRNNLFTVAFVLGLTIDIFNNTQGMNAFSCLVLSVFREPVFNLFVTRDDDTSNPLPSIESIGFGAYFKYMATLVVLYCTLLFFIQAFTLHNVLLTIERIFGSSILSIILILGIDSLVSTHREERL